MGALHIYSLLYLFSCHSHSRMTSSVLSPFISEKNGLYLEAGLWNNLITNMLDFFFKIWLTYRVYCSREHNQIIHRRALQCSRVVRPQLLCFHALVKSLNGDHTNCCWLGSRVLWRASVQTLNDHCWMDVLPGHASKIEICCCDKWAYSATVLEKISLKNNKSMFLCPSD